MLERDHIEYYFSLKHELPEVEFKGPGRRGENPLFGRVVRGAMALANRRGGGMLIIGVSEVAGGLSFDGLTPEQLATWKYEDIASGFNSHTSSSIVFDRQEYEHKGKIFLVLHIHEFTLVPVMCMKDYHDKTNPKDPTKFVLYAGRFYIRTINHPQSIAMQTSEEIRLLSELIADKGIENFVRRAKSSGLDIAPRPQDKELFAQEFQDWKGQLLDEIRSRGYWDIRIRPVTFQPERLQLSEMYPLLVRSSLQYGALEFPYITARKPETGVNWISLEHQREFYLQSWCFFQSAQFAAAVALSEDWGDKLTYPLSTMPAPGEIVTSTDIVLELTEAFGVASRLAVTEAYRDEGSMVVEVTLCNVEGRKIHYRGGFQQFSQPTRAQAIPYSKTIAEEDIIARPWELAVEATHHFLERFGYDPSIELLTSIQSEIRN